MSLAIDVNKISHVLLADGWHGVKFFNGESTFELDTYEYVRKHEEEQDEMRLSAGQCPGVPDTGATWFDKKLNRYIACPLTAVLAVAVEFPKQGKVAKRKIVPAHAKKTPVVLGGRPAKESLNQQLK